MLKQHIQWKSPSGNPMQKTFYFNLTRTEVAHEMELEKLEERLKRFQEDVINDETQRNLTSPEIRELLDIVKVLIKHSYGIREMGPDGEEFNKEDPDIWRRFVATGAFDGFLWYLFEDKTGQRANTFMSEIWPQEIKDALAAENRKDIHLVEEYKETPGTNVLVQNAPDDGIPSIEGSPVEPTPIDQPGEWQIKDKLADYSDDALMNMSDSEFDAVVNHFRAGNNIPSKLLVMGFQRSSNKKDGGTTE